MVANSVDIMLANATHFAGDLNEPVDVMSASKYSAPARKKQKSQIQEPTQTMDQAKTKAQSVLQDYIKATIPMMTSYANVVVGKRSKQVSKKQSEEQFPPLQPSALAADATRVSSLA